MQRHQIPRAKMNLMRERFVNGQFHSYLIARELKLSTITVWRYQREFEQIRALYPDKLADMDFYLPKPARSHRLTPMYAQLMKVLPGLVSAAETGTKANPVWRKYKEMIPDGYTYEPFKDIYYAWLKELGLPVASVLLQEIKPEDMKTLERWRLSNDHRRWQIATVLRAALVETNRTRLMEMADCERKSVSGWLKTYQEKGIEGFKRAKRTPDQQVIRRVQERNDNVVKLLHERPKLYGVNRTNWTIKALTEVYNRIYQGEVSYMQVSASLKKLGCRYQKSRDMLMSPDPRFREKISYIQNILQNLGPGEKFFSIDEYGPVGIRIKGGRSLRLNVDGPEIIPQKQKCKGFIICTAALELSTNQVTHFYSLKKNTFEMIRLIELLVEKYSDQERIFFCWDAVSWHNSGILKTYISDHNAAKRPEIRLAPLPSCTQFLNVIESVFCGLARAVIHHSDYGSADECKAAIDLHFEARNAHFLLNPQRAGAKIWGKEPVKAKFSETQHTRNRNGMRGARPV